ncbi:hypothetical protein RFI_29490 [Reticulomyxa filosa]|uniref:Major facilitator superfamily (MFS) profile domain-containing protein n=1 Tax=Reticulomyxa filosa TaxID=46433 RepID=X6M4F7_RETFI|nr:hypothetical protein RFI_29490 [Reticulomyxa filosa]|eukprot:ETO07900.1 hypothetical protein RFI_29490 [Reticulomyxa filosa]
MENYTQKAMATSMTNPLSASLIAEYFPNHMKATAMSLYNVAVYVGFSIALGLGNIIQHKYSWRYVWWIFGFAGCVWSIFVCLLPTPNSNSDSNSLVLLSSASLSKSLALASSTDNRNETTLECTPCDDNNNNDNDNNNSNTKHSITNENTIDAQLLPETTDSKEVVELMDILRYLIKTPSLMLLLIVSLYRNSGGYVWAYQANNYFANVKHQSDNQIAIYMFWVPAVGGSIGLVSGSIFSDQLVKRGYPSLCTYTFQRIIFVVGLIGTLFLPPPYCYLSMFVMYLFSEQWISICVTLVMELTPDKMKSTMLSVYYFIVGFAGFMPQLFRRDLKRKGVNNEN